MFDALHDPDPPAATTHHLAAVAERAERRRRRRAATAMGTVAAVLVAGGATALALRDLDRGSASTPTAPPASPTPTHAPVTTTPATAPATPTPTTATTSTATLSTTATTTLPASTVPAASIVVTRDPSQPAPPELVTLAATIAERARSVTSFGGTVEQIQGPAAEPASVTIRSVAFRADGSMWATDDRGGWASFDAATGISRLAFRSDPAGELEYQEIVGWNDNFTGEQVVLGFSPVTDVAGLAGEIAITEAPYPPLPDRAAWRLEQHAAVGGPLRDAATPTVTDHVVYWIDQATGLTLAVERAQTGADGVAEENYQASRLTAFATDVEFPPEFPGAFPPGATVARSGDPAAFSSAMTDAELQAAFGDGLLVPGVPATGRQIELSWQINGGDGLPIRDDGTAAAVWFTIHRGFDRTSLLVERSVVATPGQGAEVVGTVVGGVLDGLPIYPAGQGRYAVFTHGDGEAIVVTSSAATVAQAAELLGTVRRPGI
jgi:hypothetical protein